MISRQTRNRNRSRYSCNSFQSIRRQPERGSMTISRVNRCDVGSGWPSILRVQEVLLAAVLESCSVIFISQSATMNGSELPSHCRELACIDQISLAHGNSPQISNLSPGILSATKQMKEDCLDSFPILLSRWNCAVKQYQNPNSFLIGPSRLLFLSVQLPSSMPQSVLAFIR